MHIQIVIASRGYLTFPVRQFLRPHEGARFWHLECGGGVNVAIVYLCILQQNTMGIYTTVLISFQFLPKIHAHIPKP